MIEIRCISEEDPTDFEVVVPNGRSETHHHVTTGREFPPTPWRAGSNQSRRR